MIPTQAVFNVLARWLQPRWAALLVAAVGLAASGPRAKAGAENTALRATAKSSVKHTSHETKNGAPPDKVKSAARHTGHSASKSKAAKHSQISQTHDGARRSLIRPEPQRVQEIQRALIQAGELHQEPTGNWDEATRDAMKRYQEEHGFGVTGLPDSKSLMKMGLGPHPLPPEVATPAATRASLDPTATSTPESGPGGYEPPADADPPQEHR